MGPWMRLYLYLGHVLKMFKEDEHQRMSLEQICKEKKFFKYNFSAVYTSV